MRIIALRMALVYVHDNRTLLMLARHMPAQCGTMRRHSVLVSRLRNGMKRFRQTLSMIHISTFKAQDSCHSSAAQLVPLTTPYLIMSCRVTASDFWQPLTAFKMICACACHWIYTSTSSAHRMCVMPLSHSTALLQWIGGTRWQPASSNGTVPSRSTW